MPSTPRLGLPSFWNTHIAKVLVGDQPCLLSPWLSGHFELEKRQRDGQFAIWKTNHTEMLRTIVTQFTAQGWKCDVEKFIKVTGQHAIISAKADLIAQKKDCRPLVVDAKSGLPRDSDVAQVMTEMILLPLFWKSPGMIFGGRVVYETHTVEIAPSDADKLKPKLFALLKHLGLARRPEATPSVANCRFCEVSEVDCPNRCTETEAPVLTTEF